MNLLLVFILSFLWGVIIASVCLEHVIYGVLLLLVSLLVILHFVNRWSEFVVLLLAFCFGFFRFGWALGGIDDVIGIEEFEGVVCDEVDVRSDKVKYTLCVEGIDGRVLVNSSKYPLYSYGDNLSVFGELVKPDDIEDFEYDKYLARFGIYGVVYDAKVFFIESASSGLKLIYSSKKLFEARLFEVFSEPYGSFLSGLLLGSRRGISKELLDKFNATGLTHIVAISGYNITLIIVVIGALFKWLPKRIRIFLSVFFVVIFVFLVGASAAVVRAGVMGVISLMALYFGRSYYVFLALLLSAFLMNLWNPKIIVYDVGFQLSFLATLGIVYFVPILEKYFKWCPQFLGIKEAFLLTISAQIFTLPVILYNFGRFSLIAPIANMLVLPFIPFAMLFGFFGVLFGKTVGFVAYVILKIVIFIVEVLAF